MLAKSYDKLGGNKNGYYFIDNKENKFRFDNIKEEFRNNKELYKIMFDTIIPELEKNLSSIKPEEIYVDEEEMNYGY